MSTYGGSALDMPFRLLRTLFWTVLYATHTSCLLLDGISNTHFSFY